MIIKPMCIKANRKECYGLYYLSAYYGRHAGTIELCTRRFKTTVRVLNHEIMHKILHEIIDHDTCDRFDNISDKLDKYLKEKRK